jgi:serine/threonine protein kinase
LDGNQLEGNIPRQLSGCRDLTFLALEGNNLTGYIPQELGSLAHLQELNLGSNNLIEYGLSETISTKGDVYSYGILLLEMLTGKRPTSDMFVGDLNLHKWVNLAFPNKVKDVIDNGLFSEVDGDEFVENSIYKCLLSLLQVGLLCSKDSFDERPTMRDVVLVLENLREDLVANKNDFRRSRQSISTLLSKTNAARNKE